MVAWAIYSGNQKKAEKAQDAVAFARTVPAQFEPSAKDIMARACSLADWIDHLELKRGEPLPDSQAPWEKLPQLESKISAIESKLGQSEQFEILVARDKVARLRDAAEALRTSAADLLTAQVARDTGQTATAKSKFESARKQAERAVSRAEQAMEPVPNVPTLEGGAVMMTAEDPCDAL
jgi:hypothetical protein